MHKQLEEILSELYQADPSLREHDATLRKLVVELMELKPDTQFDETFRYELRRKIMALAETQEAKPSLTSIFMRRFQLAGAGVAVLALLVASAWYLNGIKNPSSNLSNMLSGPKITRAGDNAFGSLANVQQNGGRGQGGGGNGNVQLSADNASTMAPEAAPNMGVGIDSKMIAPNPVNFRYVYKGEELTLIQDKVDVLKRQKNFGSSALGDFVSRVSMGLVDLNSFQNTQLQNFTFAEDRDNGYSINVSLMEGTISINENWPKWQALSMPCGGSTRSSIAVDYVCEPKRIDISQVPADQVLIDAANAFLEQHSIPRSIYGEPYVNNDWRISYDNMPDKSNYWVPDVMSIVYPLVIDGQTVYEEGGNPMGLNVSVRISPEVRVSGAWELTTQDYQSSSYDAVTDVSRIMGLVEKGGFRNYYYMDPSATKTVDIELGTPEVSYVKLWNYAEGKNEELLVPALIFPVTKEPSAAEVGPYYWYRKNVVIPLVKEILDNENAGGGIMPMTGSTEPAVDAVAPTPKAQ